jgi:predicted nucleic acid-binding protein
MAEVVLSVLCRRATERKTSPPDLQAAITLMRGWFEGSEVRFLARESERLAGDLLNVIAESDGALNSNDALLVVLEREGAIDNLASFDSGFDDVEGFRRLE